MLSSLSGRLVTLAFGVVGLLAFPVFNVRRRRKVCGGVPLVVALILSLVLVVSRGWKIAEVVVV